MPPNIMRWGDGFVIGHQAPELSVFFRDANDPKQGLLNVQPTQVTGWWRRSGVDAAKTDFGNGTANPLTALTNYEDPHAAYSWNEANNGWYRLCLPSGLVAPLALNAPGLHELVLHVDVTGDTDYQFERAYPLFDLRWAFFDLFGYDWKDFTAGELATLPAFCLLRALYRARNSVDVNDPLRPNEVVIYDPYGVESHALTTAPATGGSQIGKVAIP